MLGLKRKSGAGEFAFRVSDVVDVPLRGTLLRLRLVEGAPAVGDLAVGSTLRMRDPAGAERDVVVKAHTTTGGRPTQKRLEATREFDVLVDRDSASATPIDIGWMAHGPV